MAILKPFITCILLTPETAIELCHTLHLLSFKNVKALPKTQLHSGSEVSLRPEIPPKCSFPGTGVSQRLPAALLQPWELPGRERPEQSPRA